MRVDQDVAGLQVTMNDAFLVAVMDGVADLAEQLEPLARAELLLLGVLRDGLGVGDVLHGEVGDGFDNVRSMTVAVRIGRQYFNLIGAGLVDLGDAGVPQAGKDLGFILEPPHRGS